jgi:filamentous hemagglutinin family protein
MNPRACWGIWLAVLAGPVWGEAVTDGTLGPARSFSGHFEVGEDVGARSGANLFHSFRSFGIKPGESATFTGAPDIQNVVTRVTGGQSSVIDGPLRSRVGKADFWFINPAGIVFGQNASLDMPASFRVSTADELRFRDGARFSATQPTPSSLSLAQPEAYGFLGDRSREVLLLGQGSFNEDRTAWQGTQLKLNPGATLDVVAGKIGIEQAQLSAPGGALRLINAQQGAVPVDRLPKGVASGRITLNQGFLDTSGNPGGTLALRGGQVHVRGSSLFADTHGDADAESGSGVRVTAGSLRLDQGSLVTANPLEGRGRAGSVRVQVQQDMTLADGAVIDASTASAGNAGQVAVRAGRLAIDGQGRQTGIFSTAVPGATGKAGSIDVKAGTVELRAGGRIESTTYGTGAAGHVTVATRSLFADGKNLDGAQGLPATGVFANAGPGSSGRVGNVTVNASDYVRLRNRAGVTSINFGISDRPQALPATWIRLEAPTIFLNNAAVAALALGNTAAGNIYVKAARVLGLDNSTLSTRSLGADGGNIEVDTPVLLLRSGQITANSEATGGSGGTVSILADALIPSGNLLFTNQNISFLPIDQDQVEYELNVIQAAAPEGVGGTVTVSTPPLDWSGQLVSLDKFGFAAEALPQDWCDLNKGSSFTPSGRGGLPPQGKDRLDVRD